MMVEVADRIRSEVERVWRQRRRALRSSRQPARVEQEAEGEETDFVCESGSGNGHVQVGAIALLEVSAGPAVAHHDREMPDGAEWE